MCNFNTHDEQTKDLIHLLLEKSAQTVGGVNFFLELIETLRSTKPHPLTTNKCRIDAKYTTMTWNKVIFKDKLLTLEEIITSHKSAEGVDFNILNTQNEKKKKKILNVIRTLTPVEFVVKPKDTNEGNGFSFKVFDTTKDDNTTLNPLFIALFFCSIEYTKKALKHTL